MSGIPEGWYDDGSGTTRWWDGNRWTEDVLSEASRRGGLDPWEAFGTFLQKVGSLGAVKSGVRDGEPVIWEAKVRPSGGGKPWHFVLTAGYLRIERGRSSANYPRISTADIREVFTTQSVVQKLRGVGNIVVRADHFGGGEDLVLEGIKDFRLGATLISHAASEARRA